MIWAGVDLNRLTCWLIQESRLKLFTFGFFAFMVGWIIWRKVFFFVKYVAMAFFGLVEKYNCLRFDCISIVNVIVNYLEFCLIFFIGFGWWNFFSWLFFWNSSVTNTRFIVSFFRNVHEMIWVADWRSRGKLRNGNRWLTLCFKMSPRAARWILTISPNIVLWIILRLNVLQHKLVTNKKF